MPCIQIEGLNKYYEIHGEGETVVLLHHGFGCSKMWKDIYPAFLEKGYRVIMYDRRGYGLSDPGKNFFSFYISRSFRAEAVKELMRLRERLGLETFHLVGQCEGGVVAVDYATACPAHVKSIVTSSTQCFSPATMRDFNREKFQKSFRDLEPQLQTKLLDWHGSDRAEAFFEQFRTEGGEYGSEVFDLRPILPYVQCPALVLFPDRSFLFDVEQGVHFYRHLKKGELAVLPRCGHNTYEQKPQEYIAIISDFLKRAREATDDRAQLMATCVASAPGS
ncbi:MAG: alpha/beta hydrolase [Desulfobacteraceae bacterium]|jgi:pimeloyl-ACP methyl ester carboxylesterase|nr:MAG: alpha/beta hydrolase [Desulfobacteraceae bacterium]